MGHMLKLIGVRVFSLLKASKPTVIVEVCDMDIKCVHCIGTIILCGMALVLAVQEHCWGIFGPSVTATSVVSKEIFITLISDVNEAKFEVARSCQLKGLYLLPLGRKLFAMAAHRAHERDHPDAFIVIKDHLLEVI